MDEATAGRYFAEARALCARDGGRLWGRSLCGPMMFVDPATRAVLASERDKEGLLKRSGEVYVGTLPPNVNVANTAVEWAGVNWMMVMTSAVPSDRNRPRPSVDARALAPSAGGTGVPLFGRGQ